MPHPFTRSIVMTHPDLGTIEIISRFGRLVALHLEPPDGPAQCMTPRQAEFFMASLGVDLESADD